MFDKLYSTNLTYVSDDVKNSTWFYQVDCSPYLATIVDALDKHHSISGLINGKEKVLTKLQNKPSKN